jgi:hypothetical protein
MEDYFGAQGGKTCKYAEEYHACLGGLDYLCTNKEYFQEVALEDELFCCDADSQPQCGHFEIRDDYSESTKEEV